MPPYVLYGVKYIDLVRFRCVLFRPVFLRGWAQVRHGTPRYNLGQPQPRNDVRALTVVVAVPVVVGLPVVVVGQPQPRA